MKNKQCHPDFFIVGAPKCGTTAMNDYLRQHPQIFMPELKDLTFFGKDLEFRRPRINYEKYLALFKDARECDRIGETSVWYMYSRSAAKEIKSFSAEADILVMLRNPVDMLYSQHSQFLYNCNEDLSSFEEALDAEEARKRGQQIPRRAHFVEGLFYRETARYAEQIERYMDVFGPEKVHIILFDDFKKDTPGVFKHVLSLLGVDPSFRPKFKVVNSNKVLRSRLLQEFLVAPPLPLVWMANKLTPNPLQGRFLLWLRDLNSRHQSRPALDQDLRYRLQAEFQPEIERLSRLIGRDLSMWSC